MANKPTPKRCAIYTRKSSDEGLEMEFNSLDAQREACEAFIISQKHEGWTALPEGYDDGGFSGGSMDRPALKRLLADIALGRIDVVVVYKVDRLTRALADFAKIVETFDEKSVSFVSVTQQFNTTSSMGRLTLNVLLSFAQFEREVTSERIRDKFAASKKKGMWMGGVVPLGYDAKDRKLHIVSQEAAIVQDLFNLYLEHCTVEAVKHAANERGYRTKHRPHLSGKLIGGHPFHTGHIYKLLHNPIYAGYIHHKGTLFEGEHQAIIDREIWHEVQRTLESRSRRKDARTTSKHPSLLAGRIFDANGKPLTPSHANKKGRRYRYYISSDIIRHGIKEDGWRIPAAELEGATKRALTSLLTDQTKLIEQIRPDGTHQTQAAIQQADLLASRIDRQLLIDLDVVITFTEETLSLSVSHELLRAALQMAPGVDKEDRITFDVPIQIKRRGIDMKLVIGANSNEIALIDPTLIKAIARGRKWFKQITSGKLTSLSEIAKQERVTLRYVTQHIDLAFLSPTIVDAILKGHQPADMSLQSLKRTDLPIDWSEQVELLGF